MADPNLHSPSRAHVVIIGGGFGGLYAAQALARAEVDVTLVDRRNFHLFQPLLYQVATGGLSPGDIASPLRAVLSSAENVRVIQAEVVDIDPAERRIALSDGAVDYDYAIVATGTNHNYFGNDGWSAHAPGLKTIEDALDIRRRVLLAFEAAEREPDPHSREAWLRFVVVGGGPTGVELAGALAELARHTLRHDFKLIDPGSAEVILVEGLDRILSTYPPDLSDKAAASLHGLGVSVRCETFVTGIDDGGVSLRTGDVEARLEARTVLWAAGMQASPLGQVLERRAGAELDRAGRVIVGPGLSLPDHPEIFVIGDLAHFAHQGDGPLPGVAPVAMQQGSYVAKVISERLSGKAEPAFRYRDRGSLAVIGRNAAVADFGRLHLSGVMAWLVWVFVHIGYLIGFDNKLLVMIQWAWDYLTRNRGARLITGPDPFPLVRD